ncbi:DNA-binding LacI/PurR family transcriptional regulator [Diaminobutyricimonas aerilata]|uniref:DNA-binding LacI/PurR family transcriptional regulator n=1 Tax=Diaminobutyricimonas aerilata TaxID=1162967 RepID=A0A2M9CNR6_9MICO|nr:LacI family DNA-binding transcriptional regulator [Diaminobutyricimonas aerilata]PJJ73555.1 DNA-binding LacI/PurR family transcriptional regulator [Diaminobutyricimonas aerilata]
MRGPTIADVARRAGVSKGLVSFALNNRPGVADGTRRRILEAADELGWQPSMRARSLSTNRAFALGLIIAREPSVMSADAFFPMFIAGVESELGPAGQALVLSIVPGEDAELAAYRSLARDRRVDGVFITDLRADDPRIALATELGLPAVTLGRPDSTSPHPAVTLDDDPGIRAAVDHLVELGHRRIAHVGGPDRMLHGTRRRESFAAALQSAGLESTLSVSTDFSAAEGAAATRHLLALDEPPTAIVYANDHMAVAGLAVAQSAGVVVPRDLSITGFDGTEVGEHVYPALTTVATDVVEWGRASARVLLQLVTGEHPDDLELPPARLVVRSSTAPAPHPAT